MGEKFLLSARTEEQAIDFRSPCAEPALSGFMFSLYIIAKPGGQNSESVGGLN